MTKNQSILDIFLPYQREFFLNPKKRKIWVSSRQCGKSFCVGGILTYKALAKKNGLSLCISTGARAASEIIRKCQQFAEAVELLSNGEITYTASYDSVKFSNGSRVLSLPGSTDGANLRGYTAQCVAIDEACFIPHLDEIITGIGPTLTRDPNAELILTTTPAGKNSPVYKMLQSAMDDPDWYCQRTTIHEAIKQGLKVDLKSLHSLCPDPDKFAQEYECKWLSEFGSFIDSELLVFSEKPEVKVRAKYCGYDVGGTGDRTAIATVCELEDGTYFLEDIVILKKTPYTEQLKVLKQLHNTNNWSSGYVDSQGIGNPIAEFASKQVSSRIQGFAWSASNKTPVLEHCRGLILDRKLVIAEHLKELIISEFQNIEKIVTEDGKVKYVAGHNENGHSDSASALFLALWAAHEHPTSFALPTTYVRKSPFGSYGSWGSNGSGRLM